MSIMTLSMDSSNHTVVDLKPFVPQELPMTYQGSNHTVVDLKLRYANRVLTLRLCSNHTVVDLKPGGDRRLRFVQLRSNHTVVDLKLLEYINRVPVRGCSNHTVVDLKHCRADWCGYIRWWFQSYRSGFETVFRDRYLGDHAQSSNHTVVDLKLGTNTDDGQLKSGSNHTVVDLKPILHIF